MSSDTLFREKAPGIMALLMADFGLTADDAAAILGNLGHESGGFKFLQEIKPTVAGSEGGWGWAQWTGSRRDAFEAYCDRNGLDRSSDTANYKWLWVELKGEYAKAIQAVKAAVGLYNKVVAFELAFEKAGVKGYDSRLTWANKALAAFHAAGDPAATPITPASVEVLHPLPAATQLAPLQSGLNLQQLLPMVMAVLSFIQKFRQQTGEPTDITQILMDVGQRMTAPPAPAPAPVVITKEAPSVLTKPSVQISAVVTAAVGLAQFFGLAPPPIGETATNMSSAALVLPAVSGVLGSFGVWGRVAQIGLSVLGAVGGSIGNAAAAQRDKKQ